MLDLAALRIPNVLGSEVDLDLFALPNIPYMTKTIDTALPIVC